MRGGDRGGVEEGFDAFVLVWNQARVFRILTHGIPIAVSRSFSARPARWSVQGTWRIDSAFAAAHTLRAPSVVAASTGPTFPMHVRIPFAIVAALWSGRLCTNAKTARRRVKSEWRAVTVTTRYLTPESVQPSYVNEQYSSLKLLVVCSSSSAASRWAYAATARALTVTSPGPHSRDAASTCRNSSPPMARKLTLPVRARAANARSSASRAAAGVEGDPSLSVARPGAAAFGVDAVAGQVPKVRVCCRRVGGEEQAGGPVGVPQLTHPVLRGLTRVLDVSPVNTCERWGFTVLRWWRDRHIYARRITQHLRPVERRFKLWSYGDYIRKSNGKFICALARLDASLAAMTAKSPKLLYVRC